MKRSYYSSAHAVQSGVAFQIETKGLEQSGASPKHLRTGVNLANAHQGGLAKLLIEKGVFSEEEYVEALRAAVEREADSIQAEVSQQLGRNVSLG